MKTIKRYDVHKGLQRPIELFGFKGRYVLLVFVLIGIVVISIILSSSFLSFYSMMVIAPISAIISLFYFFYEQKKGMYPKKREKGVFVFSKLVK